ncbi:MAG: hypothetical protein JRJ60_20790, partial [Deltaproteobacteria bacterium]|nr:hypothetical protein [Deltaproteobacteria bacterium]
LVDKVTPGQKDLKKRLMVFPLIDDAGFGPQTTARFNRAFLDRLAQSPYVVLQEPLDTGPSVGRGKSIRFGAVLDAETVARTQAMGINWALIGIIQPFEMTNKRTGIWPFRGNKADYEVSVAITVVDITNTTLLLTRQESRSIRFDSEEVDQRTEQIVREEAIAEDMPKILKKQAKAVIKALRKNRWKGKIVQVTEKTMRINAGRDVGLKPGHRFDVFAPGETVTAKGGRNLAILGERVGQIEAASVEETEATAIPVSGENFRAGLIIRSR